MLDNQTKTNQRAPDCGPSATLPRSETIDVLHNRVSVRKHADRPVTEETVEAILRASFRAPTSSNIQSYSVVVVRDRAILRELSVVTANQEHVAATPVLLAFCADLTRIELALRKNGHSLNDNNLETGLVSSIDAALVGMSAYLAADSLGVKGVMIGALRNNPLEVARILRLPQRVYCVFGMCLGWPAESPQQKPRMACDDMVHYEQYGEQRGSGDIAQRVAAYDAELAKHYAAIGKKTTPESWSHEVDQKFNARPRDKLRAQLKERGFDFL